MGRQALAGKIERTVDAAAHTALPRGHRRRRDPAAVPADGRGRRAGDGLRRRRADDGDAPGRTPRGVFGSDTSDTSAPYTALDEIAPVVTYEYSRGENYRSVPWREVLRVNGAQFGREQAAEAWIAAFDAKAAALRERLRADWAGKRWAFVEPYASSFLVFGAESGHAPVTLTSELGLTPAPAVDTLLSEAGGLVRGRAEISYERLRDLDADVVFVLVGADESGATDRSGVEVLESQPLWGSLPAVRNGRVAEFTSDVFGESGLGATAFLDVVEQALLGPASSGAPSR